MVMAALALIISCERSTPVIKLEVNEAIHEQIPSLATSTDSAKFNLCELFSPSFDSIFIMPPYVPVEMTNLKSLKNFHAIRSIVKETRLRDDQVTLICIGDGEVISYSLVSSNPVDLASLRNSSDKKAYAVIRPKDCNQLYLKSMNYEGQISYIVVKE